MREGGRRGGEAVEDGGGNKAEGQRRELRRGEREGCRREREGDSKSLAKSVMGNVSTNPN